MKLSLVWASHLKPLMLSSEFPTVKHENGKARSVKREKNLPKATTSDWAVEFRPRRKPRSFTQEYSSPFGLASSCTGSQVLTKGTLTIQHTADQLNNHGDPNNKTHINYLVEPGTTIRNSHGRMREFQHNGNDMRPATVRFTCPTLSGESHCHRHFNVLKLHFWKAVNV